MLGSVKIAPGGEFGPDEIACSKLPPQVEYLVNPRYVGPNVVVPEKHFFQTDFRKYHMQRVDHICTAIARGD